jgi:hypothetical protein
VLNWQNYISEDVDPESIDLSSFEVQDELNSKVWIDRRLDSEIRDRLVEIADDFWRSLDIGWADVKDVIFTGSLANYNWSSFSDIDLHIVVDFAEVDDNEDLVRGYFNAKRALWNRMHDIRIHDFEVGIYLQDEKEPHISTGMYSITRDQWFAEPTKFREDFSERGVQNKAAGLMDEIDRIQELIDDEDYKEAMISVDRLKEKIRKMRKTGLESKGAFSIENLAFKVLRRTDYMGKLSNFKQAAYDSKMSINQ